MSSAYSMCPNLTTAVCGPNVTSMSSAYSSCNNLTTAVCGDKVTNMSGAYYVCTNLTTAVCGPNVTNMSNAYIGCTNLTTAVCGPNVTDMKFAYSSCSNLITAACGPNVTDMNRAYFASPKIQGNAYFYSNNVRSVDNCFNRRNTNNILNIYVHLNTRSMNECLTQSYDTLTGSAITWTNDSTNNRYYNTQANIYIYPVANVYQAKVDNGD